MAMNPFERTMDLATLRSQPSRFTWGRVVNIFDMGRYSIIEGIDRQKRTTFYAYVDGKEVPMASTTLEGAMLLAIAHANLGDRTKAERRAEAACCLLGVKEE